MDKKYASTEEYIAGFKEQRQQAIDNENKRNKEQAVLNEVVEKNPGRLHARCYFRYRI